MKAGWAAWKHAFQVAWGDLTGVILLNVAWLICSWPIVTLGPALLATYWWGAHVLRDGEKEPYRSFFGALRRLFWKGLVYIVGWAAVLFLFYTSMVAWGRLLPPFAAAVVRMVWVYAVIFLLAMQPYLLELLVMEEQPWGDALKRSAWQVAANPVYSHMQVVVPVVGLVLGYRFKTLVPIVLVALVLVWWSVVAADVPWKYGERRRSEGNIEDVL